MPFVLAVERIHFVRETQRSAVQEGGLRRARIETCLEWQRSCGNLRPKKLARLEEDEHLRRADRSPQPEEAGRRKDAETRTEQRDLCVDPHRLEIPAEFEGVIAVNVSEVLGN